MNHGWRKTPSRPSPRHRQPSQERAPRQWTRKFLLAVPMLALGAAMFVPPGGRLASQAPSSAEPVDLDVVHKIRQEAAQNSQVMDHIFELTDVRGPRLTNSPGFFAAADWVVEQMQEWGIEAKQESWGPFGTGWDYSHFSAHMVEPVYAPLIGFPLAWSPGTGGTVRGEVVVANLENRGEMERYRGRLKDKIVFLGAGRQMGLRTEPVAERFTEEQLRQLVSAPPAGAGRGGRGNAPGAAAISRARGRGEEEDANAPDFETAQARRQQEANRLNQFLLDEGVLAVVRIGGNASEGGTVFAQSAGSRDTKDVLPPPAIALAPEHYNRVLRLLDREIPVTLELEVEAQILEDRTDSINVIAEIPGASKPDEVVMIGAHLDSWHGGTGATDNAAGSAVMIEVMRILKELDLPLDRTVRMALWGGEEQGLLGSRAYVKQHFADREDMKTKPEHSKLAGYFNIDNGSGKVRGIYLQGNDRMRPIFEAWFEPFADMGAGTISIRNTGGTDHTSFDVVGLPGFQFIQDWLDYNSRTHHSNMDVYDRVQSEDLQQIAAVVASFVYHAATRPELLPRKPLPEPQPPRDNSKGGNTNRN